MFTISVFPNDNYMLITMKGIISLDNAQEIMAAVNAHPEFLPEYNRLYDFRETMINWGIEDINNLIQFIKNKVKASDKEIIRKVAFVNSDSTEQALLDLFLSLAKSRFDRNFRLFAGITEAKNWITKPYDE